MFSRRMVLVVAVLGLLLLNIAALTVSSSRPDSAEGAAPLALHLTAPFQKGLTATLGWIRSIWHGYFNLVTTAEENEVLRSEVAQLREQLNGYNELKLLNGRMRSLLSFKEAKARNMVAAMVTGKDASLWYRTLIIDKGTEDGVAKGQPVVVPEGIVGQVIEASGRYAKVLLITDRNSSVDALAQDTRARGVLKGGGAAECRFAYANRNDTIKTGQRIVSSGLDGVFPKGFFIGTVSEVHKGVSGIFQEVAVTPSVPFDKLEEVLVVLGPEAGS
ncbi:rod shape-determining protein MreC [Desulfoluna sp.]|uniref:rod shape-determining protein MreC n=1 Tax=Desulfoluna sp. TaxID=2045199 RepID=UPI0026203A7E|nr:rod shape-determining protein MreC [Desulfoluna sp.]